MHSLRGRWHCRPQQSHVFDWCTPRCMAYRMGPSTNPEHSRSAASKLVLAVCCFQSVGWFRLDMLLDNVNARRHYSLTSWARDRVQDAKAPAGLFSATPLPNRVEFKRKMFIVRPG